MIRPYRSDDLKAVMQIWYEASKVGHPFFSEQELAEDRIEIIEKYIPVARQWVYDEGGQILGFIALLEKHIGGLFVAPEYHRRGIGTKLIEHAKSIHERLTVGVFKANPIARRFYEKCGFRFVEELACRTTGRPELILEWK